jgi:putative heme-binding domain-containing protein
VPYQCDIQCRGKSRWAQLLLASLAWICASAHANKPEATSDVAPSPISALSQSDLANGQKLFRVHCARCHGMHGGGGEGPGLQRARLQHANDDDELFEVINEGIQGTGMPGTWAPNDDELWQIAGYVRSLGRLPVEKMPGDPQAGAIVYNQSSCDTCHIVQGRGRGVGPELSEVGLRRNAEYLRRSINNPDADSPMTTSRMTGRVNGFLTVRAVSPNGEYEGLRIAEDEFSVQLRDLTGAIHSFDKAELVRYEKAFGHSLMPGYDTVLTTTDADNLVSYLMSLKGNQ